MQINVACTQVGENVLVECERCGPVGVYTDGAREAAVAHLNEVHPNIHTVEER